ncbi:MAG: fatty acyl-AMP ligase [Pseudonocardiaceae bacterium]
MTTLTDRVREHVRRRPSGTACTFLNPTRTGFTESTLTYQELDHGARALATLLAERDLAERPVLLLYPEGLEFQRVFLACMYANAIAVPAPVPKKSRSRGYERVTAILADTDVGLVCTSGELQADVRAWLADIGGKRSVDCLATDTATGGDPTFRPRPVDQDATLLVQYTSGSLSRPRGIRVTHRSLLHNQRHFDAAFGAGLHGVIGGWVPHFHDMGLIGHLLTALYQGVPVVTMAPVHFAMHPHLWLRMISDYGITMSAAPDFAYRACVHRVRDDQLDGVDLSRWICAINGSEPIRADTVEAFIRRFHDHGFAPTTMCPGYGLAEATLFVSGTPLDEPPLIVDVDARALEQHRVTAPQGAITRLVGSGTAPNLGVLIVHPDTRVPLDDRQVGEIWVRGESVSPGHLRPGLDDDAVFRAVTADGDRPYLRTGDLGFLDGDVLFVTGRRKEMLVLQGRNIYPYDLEAAIGQLDPGLRDGAGAVFTVEDTDESVVVLHELDRTRVAAPSLDDLAARIRHELTSRFEVTASTVALLPPRGIDRTTSGKIRRVEARHRFLDGTLDILHQVGRGPSRAGTGHAREGSVAEALPVRR